MKAVLILGIHVLLTKFSYAQPVINNVLPSAAAIGSAVTINGANFDPIAANNTVYFGAVKAIVSAATPASLTVVVPNGATYDAVRVTTSNGLTAYSPEPFMITFPGAGPAFTAASFGPHKDFLIGAQGPNVITNFDFDNDGRIDLAMSGNDDNCPMVSNQSTPGNLSFGPVFNYSAGNDPFGIDYGDIDGDGKPDLAFAHFQDRTVWILRNISTPGNRAFEAPVIIPINVFAGSLVIRDMNGDGKLDLVSVGPNSFVVLRNTSTPQNISFGTFLLFPYNYNGYNMVVNDFDGDSKPDVAFATFNSGFNSVAIYRNASTTGFITFDPPVFYLSGWQTNDLAAGDLDGDGKADIVVTNNSTNTVAIFKNASTPGNISFSAPVDIANLFAPRHVSIGDLDGDGKPDIGVASFDFPEPIISVFKNLSTPGSIILAPHVNYFSLAPGAVDLNFADMDGDGRLDMITGVLGASSYSILLNRIGCIDATIDLQPANKITCPGSNSFFAVAATNAVAYQWQVNNGGGWTNINNNATYAGAATDSLHIAGIVLAMNNNQYRCIISQTCGSLNSDAALLTVNNSTSSSVTITADPAAACLGISVTYTAIPVNGGSAPAYQWKKNNLVVGSNSAGYIDNTAAAGDMVVCEMTSNSGSPCLLNTISVSNIVTLVAPALPGPVNLGTDKQACMGETLVLDAGAGYASYLWQNGSTNRSLATVASGTYYVDVRDICNNTFSDTVSVIFNSGHTGFLPGDTSICAYSTIKLIPSQTFSQYLWNTNASSSSLQVTSPGMYWLEVKDGNGCTGRDTMQVLPKSCLTGLYMPNAFTPNNDGTNDLLRPKLYGIVKMYELLVFNQYGQIVFSSFDPSDGWDGNFKGKKQNAGTYVWTCRYQIDQQIKTIETGSTILIR